jgi:DNA polymerase-3 subunit epsilon
MDLFNTSPQNESATAFNLDKDIVFFDIESTGLNILQDRIVQIALIKYFADGRPHAELELMINPGIPIPKESRDVHGISDEMIADKPHFKAVAQQIYDFIADADLAGYNSDRFDVPMLLEELYRCGFTLDMTNRKSIDVQKIFYRMEPRTLRAALKYYCDKELIDAHDALADVRATVEVLQGQIAKYKGVDHEDGDGFITKEPIKNDMNAIYEFTSDKRHVDFTNRLKKTENGELIFNFGKYMNHRVKDVIKKDRNYFHWIMEKDFSSQVKTTIQGIMDDIIKESHQSA